MKSSSERGRSAPRPPAPRRRPTGSARSVVHHHPPPRSAGGRTRVCGGVISGPAPAAPAAAGPATSGSGGRRRSAATARRRASSASRATSRGRPAPARPGPATARSAAGGSAGPRGVDRADPVPQLQHQPLGALLADAGHLHERLDVARRDRAADLARRQDRQHRLGQPRADAVGGLQQLEHRRSSSSANPYRVSESSRTTRLVDSRAGWPTCSRAIVPGVR